MAGSTRKSLAGTAAAAAKRVIGRTASATTAAPATKSAPKASPAKAAPAKKAPAKKAPATKAAPAKKAPAKKAPAKKAPATKAPAKKAAATKTPARPSATTPAASTAAPTPVKKAPVKKTATRKASPASLVVLQQESAWTKGELDEVVTELREHGERLTTTIGIAEAELAGLMRDAGDGAGHDQADVGASSFERDHELTVLAKEREALAQIERALTRIHDGSYGVCESCGEPIGKNRLMAVPHATLCMSCKQREERR